MTGPAPWSVPGIRTEAADSLPATFAPRLGEGLRVGVASEGDPTDLRIRSGPAGVTRGLSELIQQVVPINTLPVGHPFRAAMLLGMLPRVRPSDVAHPRRATTRLWAPALAAPPMRVVGQWARQRNLAAVAPLDALIQFGTTELSTPRELRMITMQDSTLNQALRAYPWAYLEGMCPTEIERRNRAAWAAYRSAVGCCVSSHWAAESVRADYGIDRSRVHVVGLGSNFDTEHEVVVERDWSVPRFLFAGVDWKRKNGAAVLQAFAHLRRDHPEATLDVVGEHPSLVAAGVRFHGRLRLEDPEERRRLQALFQAATVCLVPSLHEPAGIVYLDAAVFGIPSIGTTNGGAETMIGDGGLLVDPRSLPDILAAMQRLANPSVAIELGSRARRHARRFTWRLVAERLLRALDPPGIDRSELADFL